MATQLHDSTIQVEDDLPVTLCRTGRGNPVLVLHGGAGPATVAPLVEQLARSHEVLAPTHPGWHGTPRPSRLVGVADLAAAYLALLDRLDLHNVTVLGSSFGGWVAAELALRDAGRRVGALVLMGAIGPPPLGQQPSPPGHAPGNSPRPHTGQGPSSAGLALLQTYTGPAMSDPRLLPRLAAISVPALVVWGADDPVVPPAYGKAYADAIPGAAFVVIPGAGHVPSTDAPAQTAAVLGSFLAERAARRSAR